MEIPLRTAYGQNGRCGMQPKAKHSLRAQAQLMRTETVETFELVKVKQKLLDIRERRENARGARAAVKKELRNCIDCFKLVAKPVSQMMGDLPIERITPCRAFEKVGIDFAGPITTKCQHTCKVVSSDEVENDVLVSLAALLPPHSAVPNQMDARLEKPNGRIPRPHQKSSLFQHQVDSRTDCGHTSWS
ncbi:hypothetical protein TNCV_4679961 [Trichonephila clavipes]|nr:hypothetical protein TNCV_4679961 [Trichonephila clavipes]